MATKKRIKKQTLREFRAWLEGVEELQPEGWCPNGNQWKLIRNKIDGIKEDIIEKPAAVVATQPNQQPAQYPGSMIPPAPIVESSIPNGNFSVAPSENQMFNQTGGKTKTPDIDTSDGNVTSAFI